MNRDMWVTNISIKMLLHPEVYKKTDGFRCWIERIRERLDKKTYYWKKHNTNLGISTCVIEIWSRASAKTRNDT